MKALSGVSRLPVRHNEGVWSQAGRETESIEKLDFLFCRFHSFCSGVDVHVCDCSSLCTPCRPLTHTHKNNKIKILVHPPLKKQPPIVEINNKSRKNVQNLTVCFSS